MNTDLSVLRDPRSGGTLKRDGDRLAGAAGTMYPIVRGIPRFVDADNYANDFGAQWNMFPRTQLDSTTGLSLSKDRIARCFHGELGDLAGKTVLEAGSGAGRFTEVLLAAGAIVHSFDFSNAVEANWSNNGASDRLTLVQGDIRNIPFQAEAYDYVVCLGVIQHTPSPEESMRSLWRMVKPGGRLIIDHYRYRIRFAFPTPIGDAASLYRYFILKVPPEHRFPLVQRLTDFWFPIHWWFRNSKIAQRIIRRVSPMRFYYPDIVPLRDRQMHYEWSLLDTHDTTTDYYKHLRSLEQVRQFLEGLGAERIVVEVGGNGIEAYAVKPAEPTHEAGKPPCRSSH